MEYFYRDMRRDTGLLMEDGALTGGKWNFDHDNPSPRAAGSTCSVPASFPPDAITAEVLDLVDRYFPENFGDGGLVRRDGR